MIERSALNLLWPEDERPEPAPNHFAAHGAHDLGVADLARGMSDDEGMRRAITAVLLHLTTDAAVLRYRQAVLDDLLAAPELVAQLNRLLPYIDDLSQMHHRGLQREAPLHEVTRRLGELETIVFVVQELDRTLSGVGEALESEGLRRLHTAVVEAARDPVFARLQAELPELLRTLRATASITIGVNLDKNLQPVEATLLSVNAERFRSSSLLGRLFGDDGEWTGIAPLHSVPTLQSVGMAGPTDRPQRVKPVLVPLFRDLSNILDKVCQPVVQALKRYNQVSAAYWSRLYHDLGFYLGAVRLIERLTAVGLPLCRPEIAPVAARVFEVDDNFNVNLALHLARREPGQALAGRVVVNDVAMGDAGRIFVLTGPNQGGKTTYMQAVGLTQVLAQAGLYVPGSRACISPADNIFTHYPVEERLESGTGRFGDEAQRLQAIFDHITADSLVLLNESLSSTAAGESLYLAQDLVRVLRLAGVRAIYATHLHELALEAEQINATTAGASRVISMVASRIEAAEGDGETAVGHAPRRSFKVVAGAPMGRSYARELATRYGVSYEQLTFLLRERGVLGHEDAAVDPADD